MHPTTALSILLFLAGTEALPQRSTHDSLLERNFKNVLAEDEIPTLAKRDPQGPASNPGEFTNVGLSNSHPDGYVPQMGDGGSSSSPAASSQSASITSAAALSSGAAEVSGPYSTASYGDSGPGFLSAFGLPQAGSQSATITSGAADASGPYQSSSYGDSGPGFGQLIISGQPGEGGRHHAHRTGSGMPHPTGHHHRPEPTGGHHRHRNGTGRYHHGPYVGEEFVETEADLGPDDTIVLHETLWQYNGTGWNHTDIPLPSATISFQPLPASLATGAVGTGTGMPMDSMDGGETPIDNGVGSPSFEYNAPRPGFVGPRDEGVKEKRAWLSGIF